MSVGRIYETASLLSQSVKRTRWVPHEPQPKQAEFLALSCREALYGGAAGGGKSDALLMAALQYVDVPGYAAILFRRTLTDLSLPDALMSRADEWLSGTAAKWSTQERTWTFPSGATLTFGYLDEERDRYRYQSAAFQYVGFDELTQFPRPWYLYLLSRLRRLSGSNLPVRMRAATNPGGIGHKWVRERFIDKPEERVFIPAKLQDNRYIDRAEYLEFLGELDSVTRAQLRDGDWEADGVGLVYHGFSRQRNVIRALPIARTHPDWTWILSLDFGVTAENSVSWLGWRPHDPVTYIAQSYRFRGEPMGMADELDPQIAEWKPAKIIGDEGGLGKGFAEYMRQRRQIPIVPADKPNKRGNIKLVNGALERGELVMVEGECEQLAEEYETLALASNGEDEAKGSPNHCADGVLYGWRASRSYTAKPAPKRAERGSAEWEAKAEERLEAEVERELRDETRGTRSRKWLRALGRP